MPAGARLCLRAARSKFLVQAQSAVGGPLGGISGKTGKTTAVSQRLSFFPKMPADTRPTPVCSTVGRMRVIIEMMLAFTHDVVTDWMLPRVAPTGRRVELPPGSGRSAARGTGRVRADLPG